MRRNVMSYINKTGGSKVNNRSFNTNDTVGFIYAIKCIPLL